MDQTESIFASRSILYLSALKPPATREDIRLAYRDAIQQALDKVQPAMSEDSRSLQARLDIALLSDGGLHASRTQVFSDLQSLVADIYTLTCICAGRSKIELDYPGGVDVRVYALDNVGSDKSHSTTAHQDSDGDASTSGPLTTTAALKASRTEWRTIDAAASEDTSKLYNITSRSASEQVRTHLKVAVGGTFDHLHVGHKLLLTATVFIAQPDAGDREITVGITGDELLVKKKHASVLESWDIRQQKSADFVESILVFHPDVPSIRSIEHIDQPGPNGKVVKVTYDTGVRKVTINYVRISDPFGPTITDESITALVISAETRAGGKAVNDKRGDKGWELLEVFEVDVLDPGSVDDTKDADPKRVEADFATKISSTEIRRRLEAVEGVPKS